MTDIRALLFDVDGTLADTERDGHRVAFNQAFAEAGLDWSWSVDTYGELLAVTGGKERIKFFMDAYHPNLPPFDQLDAFVAALHQSKTRYYVEAMKAGAVPFRPGVLRLISEAKQAGLLLGIATTTTPENVATLIEYGAKPEILGWFDVVAAGDVVPAKKPAPDIYQLAMKELGVEPEQCVALEDSENGLKSALAAGVKNVVVTVNDYTREQDFSGATLVLDHLGEPDRPCQALSGSAPEMRFLDLQMLSKLHHRAE
jgi:HAD superfamily hydrolase (TIGR01509 family)